MGDEIDTLFKHLELDALKAFRERQNEDKNIMGSF